MAVAVHDTLFLVQMTSADRWLAQWRLGVCPEVR